MTTRRFLQRIDPPQGGSFYIFEDESTRSSVLSGTVAYYSVRQTRKTPPVFGRGAALFYDIELPPRADPPRTKIIDVVVDRLLRRSGIGRQLVQFMEDRVRAHGGGLIWGVDQEESGRFWPAMGYVRGWGKGKEREIRKTLPVPVPEVPGIIPPGRLEQLLYVTNLSTFQRLARRNGIDATGRKRDVFTRLVNAGLIE